MASRRSSAAFAAPASAQVTYPKPPDEYAVTLRYRIRATGEQRISLEKDVLERVEVVGSRRLGDPQDDTLAVVATAHPVTTTRRGRTGVDAVLNRCARPTPARTRFQGWA